MVDAIERHRVCRPGESNNPADGLKLVYVLSADSDDDREQTKQDAK